MGIEAGTLGMASLGIQGVGAAAATIGAYNRSKADKYAYEYQAKVAANNAQVETWKAQDAITRGQSDVARSQLATRQLKGAQRAAMAARGIDLGEGSALNILTDTDVMGQADANTLADNAAKEAWAHRVAATGAASNASMLSTRASNESPFLSAAGTALTSAGSVAANWYALSSKGAFDKKTPDFSAYTQAP